MNEVYSRLMHIFCIKCVRLGDPEREEQGTPAFFSKLDFQDSKEFVDFFALYRSKYDAERSCVTLMRCWSGC